MSDEPPIVGRREEVGVPSALRGSITRIVRTGLVVAFVLCGIGAIGFVARGIGLGPPNAAPSLRTGLPEALLHGDPGAFAILGVAVLVATPLARVAASTALFASVGNRPFTFITLVVLVLLFATVFVGVLQ